MNLIINPPCKCIGSTLYSARLYRGLTQDSTRASAVFCMCLYHPLYITVSEQTEMNNYTLEMVKLNRIFH